MAECVINVILDLLKICTKCQKMFVYFGRVKISWFILDIFNRFTVMHFYYLMFVILEWSNKNEHVFDVSKKIEGILGTSNLLLKRC